MKHLIVLAGLSLSLPSFAINTYRTKDHTCSELKEFLRTQRVVQLKYRILGGGTHYYYKGDACRGRRGNNRYRYEARGNTILSGDGKWCFMGYRCYKVDRDDDDRLLSI